MVHLVATLANDADHMPSLLYALRNEVIFPSASTQDETWGIGYYADDRALIIRKPAELLATRTVYELAPTVQSRVILACVHRQEGSESREHAPPHRFRNWLFGYAGDLAPILQLKGKIFEKLPDFVKSEPGDGSAGWLAFAMFISELHRASLLDDRMASHEAYASALHRTMDTIGRLSSELGVHSGKAGLVATNGRFVAASSMGLPLFWKLQEGLDPTAEGLVGEFNRMAEALKRFRALVIAHEIAPSRPGWSEIINASTVYVDRKLSLETISA